MNSMSNGAPGPTAKEEQQALQSEIGKMREEEEKLRGQIADVAQQGADATSSFATHEYGNHYGLPAAALQEELEVTRNARLFAECLAELSGVLKQFEKQLRGVEKSAMAEEIEEYLTNAQICVRSHSVVVTLCEQIANMQASNMPELLREHADGVIARATMTQDSLLLTLRRKMKEQLTRIGWPPSLATGPSPSRPSNDQLVQSASDWRGFDDADPEAVDWVVRMMTVITTFQRSVQRASFELGLDQQDDPPLLWAVEVVSQPVVDRLRHHFVGNANTDRIEHPEWLFETVRKVANSLAPQLSGLAASVQALDLATTYHLPFEFVRALRKETQEILKRHTLPRLLTNHQPGLWLNFVEKAVEFERHMAPLQGIQATQQGGDDRPELWRGGSCISTICATQEFREAWWEAELGEAMRQLEEALDLPTAWTPAHLAWESATADDLDDEFGFSSPSQRAKEAWQSEFWAPQSAEVALDLVTQLAKKAAFMPDDYVQEFANTVPQRLLEKLQKHTDFEQRRLEEFREELTEGGATALGALLCSAHFLEHSLAEATGPLLLLEGLGDESAGPSMLARQSTAFGAFRQRGTLRLSLAVGEAFKRGSAAYFRKSNLQNFAKPYTSDFREDKPSAGLLKSLEEVHTNLGRLSQHLDSVVFREVWKGAAAGINRLIYNKIVTECRFSPQGAQQLEADVSAICNVFRAYTAKPAAHFRESWESARLLSAETQLMVEGLTGLHADASRMPEAFRRLGVVRLTPMQAAHVLDRRL